MIKIFMIFLPTNVTIDTCSTLPSFAYATFRHLVKFFEKCIYDCICSHLKDKQFVRVL